MPSIAAFALRPIMRKPAPVLANLSAENFSCASRNFPAPENSACVFMEGETTDVHGRRIVVTFKRHQFKLNRSRDSCWTWSFHSARFAQTQ